MNAKLKARISICMKIIKYTDIYIHTVYIVLQITALKICIHIIFLYFPNIRVTYITVIY